MKKSIITVFIGLLSVATFAQSTWKVDPYHSKINFSIQHLVISEVDGNFKTFEGAIATPKDDFSGANITFDIDASSINTENKKRDGHLQSEDFFFVEKYPNIHFESTVFKKTGKKEYTVKGNLTLRGVTKKVTFVLTYGGTVIDGYGNTKAGFIAKTTINRLDYGVAWNAKTKQGTITLGDTVAIVAKLEFVKQ